MEAVESEVLRRIETGEPVAGYKLVAGRSNRVWRDEQQAAAAPRLEITVEDRRQA
jgi:hypothetical protein